MAIHLHIMDKENFKKEQEYISENTAEYIGECFFADIDDGAECFLQEIRTFP